MTPEENKRITEIENSVAGLISLNQQSVGLFGAQSLVIAEQQSQILDFYEHFLSLVRFVAASLPLADENARPKLLTLISRAESAHDQIAAKLANIIDTAKKPLSKNPPDNPPGPA